MDVVKEGASSLGALPTFRLQTETKESTDLTLGGNCNTGSVTNFFMHVLGFSITDDIKQTGRWC